MIELPGVTLACVDTLNQPLALRALEHSRRGIRFARTMLLTDRLSEGISVSPGIEVATIDPLRSRDDYSRFILKGLLAHVRTPHVLLVQWDGYVVNPEAWESAFAEVDYLGAKWFWHEDGHDVGNGGFSLRSRRLLEALQDPRIELVEAEDTTIARTFRPLLERDYGIRFGTAAVADRFAFEAAYPIGRPFGFHGLFNFCRVVPAGELAELAQAFSEEILRSPQLAALLKNCVALNLWQPAIAIARRLVALDPSNAQAATILAHSESSLARGAGVGRNDPCPCGSGKRYKQCHGAVAGGAQLAPDTLVARGLEAHQRGDLIGAARDYMTALATAPGHPYALHYLGVVHYQRGNPAQALPLLEQAVNLAPNEPEFHNNLGLVLAALDRESEAIERYRRTLALKPDHTGSWNNLGLALHAQDDPAGAVDAYAHALALAPDAAQTRWNMALALLHQGNFDEGWPAYEARLSIPAFAADALPSTPKWDGRDAAGKAILLVAEQGLGDAIQFVRLAKPLAARGARVLLQVPRVLTRVLAEVEGVSGVVAPGDPLPPHDAWLPLLSLPRILGIDAGNIPAKVPYLQPDAAIRRDVTAALAPYAASRRIGIAWAGSRKNTNDRRRSIPLAAMAAALFDLPGTTWISLQQGNDEDDARLVGLPWRNSFEGVTALAAELDLVVSVDTSVAHVAGALARPVFILLPFSSDWRWRRGRSDSDWYPTATLFRQPAPGDWSSALACVREAIAHR
jgi:tetratricopeptide (TPR) repeat protein